MPKPLPKLCGPHASGQYYVRINRNCCYLGKDRLKAEKERLRLLEEMDDAPGIVPGRTEIRTINELILAYLAHADAHYRNPRTGEPTTQPGVIRLSVRPLQRLFGAYRLDAFGPKCLKTVQAAMVDGSWMTREDKANARSPDGWSRKTANGALRRIKALFHWGVGEELVKETQARALDDVASIAEGKMGARETGDVPPADERSIDAVLASGHRLLVPMVRLQLLSGARPGEICVMRPGDIDRSGEAIARLIGSPVEVGGVWGYMPGLTEVRGRLRTDHKTSHHQNERIIPLGPQAQAILAPFLLGRAEGAYLFSPREIDPRKQRKKKPKCQPGVRYNTSTYWQAMSPSWALSKAGAARAPLSPAPTCGTTRPRVWSGSSASAWPA